MTQIVWNMWIVYERIRQWPVTDIRAKGLVHWPSNIRDWRLVTLIFKYLTPATVTGRQQLYETSAPSGGTGQYYRGLQEENFNDVCRLNIQVSPSLMQMRGINIIFLLEQPTYRMRAHREVTLPIISSEHNFQTNHEVFSRQVIFWHQRWKVSFIEK